MKGKFFESKIAKLKNIIGSYDKKHTKAVSIATFSHDGKTFASGSLDKTIKVWSSQKGEEIYTLKGHKDGILCLSFSPDNKYLASGCDSGAEGSTAKIWNMETGKEIYTLKGHYSVSSLAFSPDGKYILTGGGEEDGSLKLWDLATGKEIWSVETEGSDVTSMSFSPDGNLITVGRYGPVDNNENYGTVEIRKTLTGEIVLVKKGHEINGPVTAFTQDGRFILSWTGERRNYEGSLLKVWNSSNGEEINSVAGSNIASVLPSGEIMAGQMFFQDGLNIPDMNGREMEGNICFCPSGSLSPDGKFFLTWTENVQLWSLSDRKILWSHEKISPVSSIAFNGEYILSGHENFTVNLSSWNEKIWHHKDMEIIKHIKFLTDKIFITGYRGGMVRIRDISDGKEIKSFMSGKAAGFPFNSINIDFSSDGKMTLAANHDYSFSIWDNERGEEIYKFPPGKLITSLAFSPEGTFIASADGEKKISIWHIETKEKIKDFLWNKPSYTGGAITSISFTTDEKYLFSATDREIIIWHMDKGELVKEISEGSTKLLFSPDGTVFLTVYGQLIKIWNRENFEIIDTIKMKVSGDVPLSLDFSPDGKSFVTGTSTGVIMEFQIY
jgi:WD40 repeat protein